MLTLPLFVPGRTAWGDPAVRQGLNADPEAADAVRTFGLHREAGWWLFNKTPFVVEGGASAAASPAVFLPNLTRAGGAKLPFDAPATDGTRLGWRTVELPPLTELTRPGYDFDALTQRLRAASSELHGPFVGYALPSRPDRADELLSRVNFAPAASAADTGELSGNATDLIARVRAAIKAVSPGAALILKVPVGTDPDRAGRDILFAGDKCDALLLDYDSGVRSLWPLKVARRTVEEQPNYDLPVFVKLSGEVSPFPGADDFGVGGFASYCLMSGATGIILQPTMTRADSSDLLQGNLNLLLGAVTLEDAGILPVGQTPAHRMDALLRQGGRLPLLGKVSSDPKSKAPPESVLVQLDNFTDALTLEELKVDAAHGASLYLEGTPDLSKPDLLADMQDLSGTKVTVLPHPIPNALTLVDPWTFGILHDRELNVEQRVSLAVRPSLAAQTKSEPGMDKLVAPRFIAKLATDPNGIVVYGVGKGRVIWNPQTVTEANSEALRAGYYGAIAGTMQGSLLKVSAQAAGAPVMLKTALRMTRNRTPLVGLFNGNPVPAAATVTFRGVPGLIIDVATGKTLNFDKTGYEATVQVTVPANGWTLLALPETQKAYDADRAGESGGKGKGKGKR